MHRSLRDFLLEPKQQQFLLQHTSNMPYDARNYLRNVRLMEILLNQSTGFSPYMSLGLASSFLSMLSVPAFRNDPRCAQFAAKFEPTLPFICAGYRGRADYWYICSSIGLWEEEKSTFLTLAIDFALKGYIIENLTADAVREKQGRPILDYALRPRFTVPSNSEFKIGNQYSIPGLVQRLLSLGADPNEKYEDISLWPSFLSFLISTRKLWWKNSTIKQAYALSIEAMIKAGAATSVSVYDLVASCGDEGRAAAGTASPHHKGHIWSTDNFLEKWSKQTLVLPLGVKTSQMVDVTDILEHLRPIFGDAVDNMKTLVAQQLAAKGD